jgi:hypothetical protein
MAPGKLVALFLENPSSPKTLDKSPQIVTGVAKIV